MADGIDVPQEDDPFEVRLAFVHLIQKLGASQHSIHRAATFARTHAHLHEELMQVLMEEVESQPSVHGRLNLFYFMDALCQPLHADVENVYARHVRSNLSFILDHVVPPTAPMNRQPVLKVLKEWQQRQFEEGTKTEGEEEEEKKNVQAIQEWIQKLEEMPVVTHAMHVMDYSHPDMIRRIEEDRERHKRSKEQRWMRHRQTNNEGRTSVRDEEFEECWQEASCQVMPWQWSEMDQELTRWYNETHAFP